MIDVDHGRHPTASLLRDFVAGELPVAPADRIDEHLQTCLACRVWAGRLRHSDPAAQRGVPESVVSRLLGAGSTVPQAITGALAGPTGGTPAPGELWRVGRNDDALLVWVRRTDDELVAVVPVVLDTDLADEHTLIVNEADSPLGLELVVMVSVEAFLDPRAFLLRLCDLPLDEAVAAVRSARRDGRPVVGITVGLPIESGQDQRLEYRRAVSDLLGDLAADAFLDDQTDICQDNDSDLLRLQDEVDGLCAGRAGCISHYVGPESTPVEGDLSLQTFAIVVELDTRVLLTVLTGAGASGALTDPATAVACGKARARYEVENGPTDAVVVVAADAEWKTVVLAGADTEYAFETPSGSTRDPRVIEGPLPFAVALFKHLETHSTDFGDLGGVSLGIHELDLASFLADHAEAAIDRVAKIGQAARIPAKKESIAEAMSGDVAARISDAVAAILSGDRPEDAVAQLLEGRTP